MIYSSTKSGGEKLTSGPEHEIWAFKALVSIQGTDELLKKDKMVKNKEFSCCKTIVGILTFMSRINFMLSRVEHEKKPLL